MKNFFKKLFGKKVYLILEIEIGATYGFYKNETEKSNPFVDLNEMVKARVKDYKDGWVLYEIVGPGIMVKNETLEAESFLRVYNRKLT